MFSNTLLPAILTALMLLSTPTVARYTMLERDGPCSLSPSTPFRPGKPRCDWQASVSIPPSAIISKSHFTSVMLAPVKCAVPSQERLLLPLLAAQPECSQQDLADEIIDASKQFDAATQANMLAIAIEYRQSEKNSGYFYTTGRIWLTNFSAPPDFTTNPPTLRNSVFCQKAPKNAALNGLVQAQDPANDPNIFFDRMAPHSSPRYFCSPAIYPAALKASVKKGSQANTAPFNGAVAAAPAAAPAVV